MAVLILFGMLYAGDWVVFRFRVARGTAYGSVEVDQFLATSLKATKLNMIGSEVFSRRVPGPSFRSEESPLAGGSGGITRSGNERFG